MTSSSFEVDQVDAAIEHVITNGAHNNGATTYYTLVFGEARIKQWLGEVAALEECLRHIRRKLAQLTTR